MSESEIKSPGLVAYPKILNPELKVKTIYFATDCRMFSDELMCVNAVCKSANTLNVVNSEIFMNPEKYPLV